MIQDLPFTVGDIRKQIPSYLFAKSESRFLVSVFQSVSMVLILGYLAHQFIPLSWYFAPVWLLYGLLNGTIAFGIWILGHECGHGSFSDNQFLNDVLGFILHESILVPYFSWQHSHAIHHAKTNHLTEGESHVPVTKDSKNGQLYEKFKSIVGPESFAFVQIFTFAMVGFPSYLTMGLSGGPSRGYTSHFIVPNKLFPANKAMKVHISSIGLLFVCYLLYLWSQKTSFAHMFVLYLVPYLVTNAWLTFITFLQHSELDVPHYDERAWTWLKGALCTIDRNFPPWIDVLHHYISTTHVLHHIFSDLPHYHAKEANIYLKQYLGSHYRSDSKNVIDSLLRISQFTCVEHKGNGVWKYLE